MRQLIAAESGQSDNSVPDEPDTLENDAEYVIDTWLERKLHGLYPESGGYNNQDASLMMDWRRMTMYYLRAKAGVFGAVSMPKEANDWLSLMGD